MAMSPIDFVKEAKQNISEIDTDAAAEKLGNSIILDVREPGEFEQGHLPGAINVPRGVLEFAVSDHPVLAGTDKEIVAYCLAGGRGALAAWNLSRMGYNVVNMLGGIEKWVAEGKATEA